MDPMPAFAADATRELLVDNLHQHAAAVARTLSRLRRPGPVIGRLGSLVGQVPHLVGEGLAPRVSFNRPVGPRRRLLLVRADLDRAKTIAHAHGAKVNDQVGVLQGNITLGVGVLSYAGHLNFDRGRGCRRRSRRGGLRRQAVDALDRSGARPQEPT